MSEPDNLRHLADLAGVLRGYQDVRGQWRETSDHARRMLLTSMGIRCDSEDAVQASIAAWHRRVWARWLPAVQVFSQGSAPVVTVRLPRRFWSQVFRWTVEWESHGAPLQGEMLPESLPVTESTEIDGESYVAVGLTLPELKELGYHVLRVQSGERQAQMALIIHPARCYEPDALANGQRAWGVSTQLYGLRSARNWGIGDFTDLRHLVEWAAANGAGMVAVNPLHALYPHNPRHASPYSPSSRCFLNTLYLDVEAVPDFGACVRARDMVAAPEFQAELRALRAAPLVDYAGVASAKFRVLDIIFREFWDKHIPRRSARGRAFAEFVERGGTRLRYFALYHTLLEHFVAQDGKCWGWPVWPPAFQDCKSAEVAAFADEHRERIAFFQYLEWVAREQLEVVGRRSLDLGFAVGVYQDLAVGVDVGGADTWMQPALFAVTAHVGAPPDEFNSLGQDWGLPALIPHALRDAAYEPFVAVLRANMRQSGALRIDHIMGLMRLYCIAEGSGAAEGAYLAFPLRDLCGLLALESQRNKCLVVGEDLGTVPEEVRSAMAEFGILSYRLLYFERRENRGFLPPSDYPESALVAISTHDLPTLAGYWRGVDLQRRSELQLFANAAEREAQIVARSEDCARLLMALEQDALLPEGVSVYPAAAPEMSPALIQATYRYVARTPAKLCLVQAEDLLGEQEQANLPGTTEGHPNWQRKLSLNIEEWAQDSRISALSQAVVAERGIAVHAPDAPPFPLRPVEVPRATYRVQLHKGFTFHDLAACVDYMAELGISHTYCSPYFKARPGSTHGYDLIDHNQFNPELGGEAGFDALRMALDGHGMSQIVDIVPNHMGILGTDNAWWLDVLEHGRASQYASYFDIEWNPAESDLQGKVLVPVLGDHYGSVLERGELKLKFDAEFGVFSLWYYDHRFPIDPREYARVLRFRPRELALRLGQDHPDAVIFESLATAFYHLPSRDDAAPQAIAERRRDQVVHKRRLAELCKASPDSLLFIEENVATFNGKVGDPSTFDLLHDLISAQAFRLAYWRVAADEINYRRFFDINDLAALRMEREEVFQGTHGLLSRMLQRNQVQGLRIDHADGLFLPADYFQRLHALYREAQPTARQGLYLIVEKILAPHERLPSDWAVAGTTGYDFLAQLNSVFIDAAAAEVVEKHYRNFTHHRETFDDVLDNAKRTIMRSSLSSELTMLTTRLSRIAEIDRYTRDYTFNSLRTALADIVASFPVYRTYIASNEPSDEDRRHIEWACSLAKKRASRADTSVYDFIRDVLLGTAGEGKNAAYRAEILDFTMRFQQYTSPVMAKGMEDTAFYRYYPLASLNEVGGEPRRFGLSVSAFHHLNQERVRRSPHGLLATSTHDTKRSEDVRARLNVLSELPNRWHHQVSIWHRLNRARLGFVEGIAVPSPKDEYLLYQTVLGIWPDTPLDEQGCVTLIARVTAYMVKAVREAKEFSSWITPNAEYEAHLSRFIEAVLGWETGARFRHALEPFAAEIAHFGRINGLAQTVLKFTTPGVPDVYQGTELWTLDVVDPDNRRPVDYSRCKAVLAQLQERDAASGPAALSKALLETASDGAVKMYVIWKTLQVRKQYSSVFDHGSYVPLQVEGAQASHVVAFARVQDNNAGPALIAVVPRLACSLLDGQLIWPCGAEAWHDTHVIAVNIPTTWRNVFTGETITAQGTGRDGAPHLYLRDLLASFPVALLVSDSGSPLQS